MLSFNFAGKNSYTDFGIVISKRPTLPSPKRRVTYINIPGKNSSARYDEKTYDDITILVECGLRKDVDLIERLDEIKGWLFNAGERDLVFSFQEDKKFIAQVVNNIDFTLIYKYISSFPIVFNCRPFKYSNKNQILTLTETVSTINNIGTLESEPIITVTGTGDITFNINDQPILLYDISPKIIINSEIKDCYDDEMNNLNPKMAGEFPVFKSGENIISWLGNVEKIEVLPNWRWL